MKPREGKSLVQGYPVGLGQSGDVNLYLSDSKARPCPLSWIAYFPKTNRFMFISNDYGSALPYEGWRGGVPLVPKTVSD